MQLDEVQLRTCFDTTLAAMPELGRRKLVSLSIFPKQHHQTDGVFYSAFVDDQHSTQIYGYKNPKRTGVGHDIYSVNIIHSLREFAPDTNEKIFHVSFALNVTDAEIEQSVIGTDTDSDSLKFLVTSRIKDVNSLITTGLAFTNSYFELVKAADYCKTIDYKSLVRRAILATIESK